jgi:type III secretion system YscQ/HrcQ family protein
MIATAETISESSSSPFPAFPAAEAERFNIMAGTGRLLAFPWAEKPAELRFTALSAAPHVTGYLRVRLDGHDLDLGFSAVPEPAALGVNFAGVEAAGLPDDLRLGVLEVCLEEVLAAAQRQGVALALTRWLQPTETLPAQLGWELTRDGGSLAGGTLHAETAALTHLTSLLARARPQPRNSGEALPMSLHVCVADMSLAVGALAALHPGDVLLPGRPLREWNEGQCTVWSAGCCIGQALRQETEVKIITMTPPSAPPPPAAPAPQLDVDALPVQLLFEIGQIASSVGQLRTLGAGFTFELPAVPDRLVTIWANGRAIGQGEIVDLGEKFGVRVAHWNLT